MRNIVYALLVGASIAAPLSASAQTPRDLVKLAWGNDLPAAAITAAPRVGQVAAGASAADLARLTWPQGALAVRGRAPAGGVFAASGGTARDLARLTAPPAAAAPMLQAAMPQTIIANVRPHG